MISRATSLAEATKCVLVSFDSTMRSNLSVGMPIDVVCYERDSLELRIRHRFDAGDAYFKALSTAWSAGVRQVFRELPDLPWFGRPSAPGAPRTSPAPVEAAPDVVAPEPPEG